MNAEIVPDHQMCDKMNYSWVNSEVHFDHVGMAYLALFQVATWKGWIQIMNDAIDATQVSCPFVCLCVGWDREVEGCMCNGVRDECLWVGGGVDLCGVRGVCVCMCVYREWQC